MTQANKMRIRSTADLLRWLDTARTLARNVLRDAGAGAALVRAISDHPMDWYCAPGSSTIRDPASGVRITFTQEMAAAVLMFDCCDSLSAKLKDPATPAHLLVLEGYCLSMYEDAMKETHWAAVAEREKQSARAARKRAPRIPASMVKNLRSQGMTWETLKRHLPRRVGKCADINGYRVTLSDDGRLIVTYNAKSSRPVAPSALREYFGRD